MLALELFDAALRAASPAHLGRAADALLADPSVPSADLCRCARRLVASDLDARSARRLVRGAIERGDTVALQLGGARLELEDLVILVDVPAVELIEPVELVAPWDGTERHRLMLLCARHVLGIFEQALPGDHRPREIVEALARLWRLEEGRPRLGLEEAWALADGLPTTQGGPDDIGWGLRYMIEGQATLALEAFRTMRGVVAHGRVWDCYDRDGETLIDEPDDPLLQRALDSAHDAEATARQHERELAQRRERDDELAALFGELRDEDEDEAPSSSSTRAAAAGEARELAEQDELHWQIDQILRHLLT